MLLLGQFDHSIDPKGRLAIPAEIRGVLKPEVHGDALIAAPGANETLWLWPERTFEQFAAALGGSLLGDEDMLAFERHLFSQASRCSVDSAGRIRIPDRLLKEFSIDSAVVIAGVRDHLELMSPARWAAEQTAIRSRQSEIWRRARAAHAEAGRKNQS
ncbi:MAG: division/cell wall cluster transcriptional repressor MraZ [Phycisphaerales bacterium]